MWRIIQTHTHTHAAGIGKKKKRSRSLGFITLHAVAAYACVINLFNALPGLVGWLAVSAYAYIYVNVIRLRLTLLM